MSNFYLDVIEKSPSFWAQGRINTPALLEPRTLELVKAIISDAAAEGVELGMFETYRSDLRQQALFAHGASKLRTRGVHHYGLACDLVKRYDGEWVWKGDYSIVGRLAERHGLVWGGNWPHFPDLVHVQRCAAKDQPHLFDGAWYPSAEYQAR